MASINLKGYLRETLGALSSGNKIRFTHATTTGETIAGSVTNYVVADDGYYDINIEYGNVFIETSDKSSRSWQVHGTTTINASTAATTLPTLLNSVVPPTDQQILLFQNLVADAEAAKVEAEAAKVEAEAARDEAEAAKVEAEAARDEAEAAAVNSLQYRVGQKAEIHSSQIPDWLLKADGSIVSRTVDDVLWAHAATSGLVIAQATKDANPEQYAMYYGDGDGSTTFSLPNWYLGHFARGNPAGVALGETQGDAIRNITGYMGDITGVTNTNAGGAFGVSFLGENTTGGASLSKQYNFDFNVSRVVPTANENRPKSGHINICIERGKIPV